MSTAKKNTQYTISYMYHIVSAPMLGKFIILAVVLSYSVTGVLRLLSNSDAVG